MDEDYDKNLTDGTLIQYDHVNGKFKLIAPIENPEGFDNESLDTNNTDSIFKSDSEKASTK